MFTKSFFRFPRFKLRRRHYPEFTNFGRDACEVIGARTAKGITGTLSAAEAHRMVAEKQAAAVRAYFAFVEAVMHGEAHSAPTAGQSDAACAP